MNKTEFIAAVAEKAGLTKADAQRAVNAFTEVVKETMEKGDRLPLVGFGTFSVSERKAREGKNPRTGETIKIAALEVVHFKPGANLDLK